MFVCDLNFFCGIATDHSTKFITVVFQLVPFCMVVVRALECIDVWNVSKNQAYNGDSIPLKINYPSTWDVECS